SWRGTCASTTSLQTRSSPRPIGIRNEAADRVTDGLPRIAPSGRGRHRGRATRRVDHMIRGLRITQKLMLVFAGFGGLLLASLTALAYVEGQAALREATISDLSSAAA